MKTALLALFFTFAVLPAALFAVTPQFWEESSQESYADGDPQSVSITSDGELLLAPQLKKIYDGTQAIIWKIVRDSKGNLFAATGNEGKVLKIDSLGKVTTALSTKELEVQALVIDKNDNVYAATSPDGKIYKIKSDGASSVYYDPPDRYIWSLAFDDDGNLYVGTGDQGKIYKVDKNGNGSMLIDTNETNITVVVWDKSKKLLAGSDKDGVLYSVDATGKAFVLFDSELEQITSIYSDPAGEVYFSAISGNIPGGAQKTTTEPVQPTVPVPQTKPTQQETSKPQRTQSDEHPGDENPPEGEAEVTTSVEVSTVAPQPASTAKPSGASQVYRITNNGLIEEVYTAAEDQILDITGYKQDQLILSTGKKAKLILLDKNKKSTILLKAPEEQITSLIPGNRVFLATANPGNVYELAEDHASKGTYYSDTKDTQTLSQWGQISWKASIPGGTSLSLSARSGNTRTPDTTWSAWTNAGTNPAGKAMSIPKARFVQWKADFTTDNAKNTPVLREVKVAYLQQNIRPEVVSITLSPPGTVFRKAFSQESFAGVPDEDDTAAKEQQDQQDQSQGVQAQADVSQTLGKKEYKHGYETVTWNAVDENQDDLRYDVYYKASGEKNWKALGKDLREKVFAWDTETMPDGTYNIKVIVNDSGSNPKEYVLTNEKESDTFDVDNSAPQIQVVGTHKEKNGMVIEVQAKDQYSAIKDMQYSVQPGVWNQVFPVDAINDSPTENYRIELKAVASSDIVFKCSDRGNNIATIKYKLPQ